MLKADRVFVTAKDQAVGADEVQWILFRRKYALIPSYCAFYPFSLLFFFFPGKKNKEEEEERELEESKIIRLRRDMGSSI